MLLNFTLRLSKQFSVLYGGSELRFIALLVTTTVFIGFYLTIAIVTLLALALLPPYIALFIGYCWSNLLALQLRQQWRFIRGNNHNYQWLYYLWPNPTVHRYYHLYMRVNLIIFDLYVNLLIIPIGAWNVF